MPWSQDEWFIVFQGYDGLYNGSKIDDGKDLNAAISQTNQSAHLSTVRR
jgi:hypothetical protein